MTYKPLMINTELLNRFKAVCAQRDVSMKSVAEELISAFLVKNERANPGLHAPADVNGTTKIAPSEQ